VWLAMVCDYIPVHETTFMEAYKVSRSMPRWVSTNMRMA